jgi:hypothetical protein
VGDSGFLFEEVVVCKLQMPFSGKFLRKVDIAKPGFICPFH